MLTEVEHGRRPDEGHEVNPRREGQHAHQDERRVADAAAKHHDAEEASEENQRAGGVPITHLEVERQRGEAQQTPKCKREEGQINVHCSVYKNTAFM